MVGGDGWTKHIKDTVEPPTVEGLGEATACVGGCVERVSLLVDARSRPEGKQTTGVTLAGRPLSACTYSTGKQ